MCTLLRHLLSCVTQPVSLSKPLSGGGGKVTVGSTDGSYGKTDFLSGPESNVWGLPPLLLKALDLPLLLTGTDDR